MKHYENPSQKSLYRMAIGSSPFNIYALQWQSLHMSAAAACRSLSPTGGHGCCGNQVLPRIKDASCTTTCAKTNYHKCDGELAIMGYMGKAKMALTSVGSFYNYHCNTNHKNSATEANIKENYLWSASYMLYISYCCCRK